VTPIAPHTVNVLRSIVFFLLYAFIFWRTFKDNRGNRVIQCGSITLMLFLLMMALLRIPHFPVDYVAWLGLPLLLLCILTLFFLVQQGYRALRHRKIHKHSEAISSETAPDERNLTK
jgi:drug/metabolite transporter superfamily protein YnfA